MTLILPVDTAVALLVNVVPLTDDTDFKTRKTSVAYNASGMDLVWNFQATDGTITQTAVTPTSGGDYDWSHVGDGLYKIEMPASGGVSANNDSEGYGFFSGVCDGVLPWRGPTYTFVPAAIVNSLVGGTDNLPVDVVQIGGNTQSATDLKDFADTGYDPSSHKVAGVVLVDTCTTNTDMRGTDNASTFDPGSDTVTVGANQDKTGYSLSSDYDAAKTAAQAGDEMDLVDSPNATAVAVIQSGLSTLSQSDVRDAVGLESADLDDQLAAIVEDTGTTIPAALNTIADYIDTEVSAIKVVTDNLPDGGALTTIAGNVASILADTRTDGVVVATNNDKTGFSLSDAAINAVADATLARGVSNVEDTADRHSLAAVVMIQTNASVDNTTLIARKPSDDSEFATYTITVDQNAKPVTGIS